MEQPNPMTFKHKFSLEILPTETLLGAKLINCDVLCDDKQYHSVIGIELGFIFFTISYVNLVE